MLNLHSLVSESGIVVYFEFYSEVGWGGACHSVFQDSGPLNISFLPWLGFRYLKRPCSAPLPWYGRKNLNLRL